MLKRIALALAFAATAAGAAAQSADAKKLPEPEGLSEPNLYEFLLGEIAVQRGDFKTAAESYLDLAKRTRDPRIAKRATEVAAYARMPSAAIDAAKI